MAATTVPIHLANMFRTDLTPSLKLVDLGRQLERSLKKRILDSPTRLQRLVGASRPTIRKAMEFLEQNFPPKLPRDLRMLGRLQIDVYPDLITTKTLPAMARVVYCVLLGLQEIGRTDILSTYTAIAKVLHVQARTIRLAVRALEQTGWLGVKRVGQRRSITFSFPDPKEARQSADVRRAEQRLEKGKYHGETLALLWCDTLVDSTNHRDDYFPRHFINPETNELLQADRYYLDHDVAIEFQGPQHDGETPRFPKEVVEAQMKRDQIKRQICHRQKIPLIEVRPEDLTFERMRELLGKVLPQLDRTADEPIIAFLEQKSKSYRQAMENIKRQSNSGAKSRSTPQKGAQSLGPSPLAAQAPNGFPYLSPI